MFNSCQVTFFTFVCCEVTWTGKRPGVDGALESGCCQIGGNPFDGYFRDERVTVGTQASHSGGSAMSQRECAGFNCPPLSIHASEPVSISPEAVSRAGADGSRRLRTEPSGLVATVAMPAVSFQYLAEGVDQPTTLAAAILSVIFFAIGS